VARPLDVEGVGADGWKIIGRDRCRVLRGGRVGCRPLGRRRALRLRAREARRGGLKGLAGEGDGHLFVGGGDAPWAARVAEGLDDEVLLAGTTPAMEAALLGRAGRPTGTLAEGE